MPEPSLSASPVAVVAGAVAVLALVVGVWIWRTHTRLVGLRQLVTQSQRAVDVELARRHTLIPDLVSVVRAHAAHEHQLLQIVGAERGLLHPPLVATAERYPALAASGSYQRLAHELKDTEDRLAAARRIHSSNVERYASLVGSFPASVLARRAGFGQDG